MRFTNTTPFPTLCFETTGPDGPVHTVVVRATATIIPEAPLFLADEQLPIRLTDCYFGKPGASSLKYPSDLAPFKPKTDIIVIATSYAPARQSRGWRAEVTVGQHKKSLIVIGDCFWKKTLFLGWHRSQIAPASKVPIRYENAYGGALALPDERGGSRIVDICRENPVGKGWGSPLAPKLVGEMGTYPMAQIYAHDTQLEYGKVCSVEGFGAIAPNWRFRQRYIGSWDEGEGDGAAPAASDFDFLFYNCAHPDLIVPYLKGDEAVQLLGLAAERKLNYRLPGHTVHLAAKYAEQQEPVIIPGLLDTLIIEPDDMRASLVWRATVPIDSDIKSLEAQFCFNEDAAGEASHD
jgi:hypothetical protein